MTEKPPILLASGSPRRRELLERAGYTVRVSPPDVDESPHPGEPGNALVERLARQKARAVAESGSSDVAGSIVVAGDTVVILAGEILGKPLDPDDARRMLRALSGETHEVVSGWCVRRGKRSLAGAVTTRVRFRALADAEIEASVASGEPLDKAGAYAIQGQGAAFVEAVEGGVENVIGLPVPEVVAAIEAIARD